MVFTRLFCGDDWTYTIIHMRRRTHPDWGWGSSFSAVLHYMVCMPCSTCSDFQKSGCQEYRPDVVSFEEKDFCNRSLAQKWVPLHYLSLAMQHWWLLLESLTTQKQMVCSHWLSASSLGPYWTWGCDSVSIQEHLSCFPSCMRDLVLNSGNAILQLWKTIYYLLVIGTILLMVANLDFVCWVDSIVVTSQLGLMS